MAVQGQVEEAGYALSQFSTRREGVLGLLCGAAIGAAAGLIGVGGGEFRIPVLLHVLRLPVKVAAGANTVIGLFVVVLSLARRWGQQRWDADALALGGIMAVASLVGATIGARRAPVSRRVPSSGWCASTCSSSGAG